MSSQATLFDARVAARKRAVLIFAGICLFATLVGIALLGVLLADVFFDGKDWLSPTLITEFPSRFPEKAGLKSALAGSVVIVILTALFSFPVGVGAAIYLEEYAPDNLVTNFIQINISNLAGVPSIVYGMLGLVVFVRMFNLFAADGPIPTLLNVTFEGRVWELPLPIVGWIIRLPFERSLLAGGLTMSLLILPIMIITSREAIRAVPYTIREAAFGLGATRWQVVRHQILPVAMPGILTGTILALSRTIGETAPLIIMGAFTYIAFLPDSIFARFTALPIQIFNWVSLPQKEFQDLAAAGIIILLVLLLSMNGLAIYLRNRLEVKW